MQFGIRGFLENNQTNFVKNYLYGRIARKKPLLAKKDNKRLPWCLEKRNWAQEKLNTVIYSDKCKLNLYSRHRTYVRRSNRVDANEYRRILNFTIPSLSKNN